jgi:hypothetical protein
MPMKHVVIAAVLALTMAGGAAAQTQPAIDATAKYKVIKATFPAADLAAK